VITFDLNHPPPDRARWLASRRRLRRRLFVLYAVLLALSALTQSFRNDAPAPPPPGATGQTLDVTATSPNGEAFAASLHIIEWNADTADPRPPVLLLHGCPGRAVDFTRLAPLLAADGRRVVAVDLLGFGASSPWVPDYSLATNASAVASLMDRGGLGAAHVLGWSNGGGVAIQLANLEPERVRSLTLLGSIGAQEFEGSGNYAFEHFKYALAAGAFVALPEAIPHFGLLGPRSLRHAFVRFFWDSDQRPMRRLLAGLKVPTLVYHGRHDVLVPARAAEAHAAIIPQARLVMIDANHFIPLTHTRVASSDLLPFFARHDSGAAPAGGGVDDRAPVPPSDGLERHIEEIRTEIHRLPWWADTAVISKGILLLPTIGVMVTSLLVAGLDIDPIVAWIGIAAGVLGQTVVVLGVRALLGRRAERLPLIGKRIAAATSTRWHARLTDRPFAEGYAGAFIHAERTPGLFAAASILHPRASVGFAAGRILGICAWSGVALLVSVVAVALVAVPLRDAAGSGGLAAGLAITLLAIRSVPMLLIAEGRRRWRRSIRRACRLEFWPAWVFYLPLAPYGVFHSLRRGHLWIAGCCNPGIEHAGGVVGESKSRIMASLGSSALLSPTTLVAPGSPDDRVRALESWMRTLPTDYPVILKPDEGQRGFGVKLVRNKSEAGTHLTHVRAGVVAQPYHEGPHECGVLWCRSVRADGTLDASGSIFSITRKTFADLTGDGVRTLEELVDAHARFSLQAPVFLERFPHAACMIPERGETVRIAMAGNHCQGTRFSDGSDLITPELEAAITTLANRFDGGFDFGRFDLRFSSEHALRRGEGFSVIELNGVTSESTNLYDPDRSIRWAYGVLFRQWRTLIDLGAARRKAGRHPPSTRDLVRMIRLHFRTRTGSSLAD